MCPSPSALPIFTPFFVRSLACSNNTQKKRQRKKFFFLFQSLFESENDNNSGGRVGGENINNIGIKFDSNAVFYTQTHALHIVSPEERAWMTLSRLIFIIYSSAHTWVDFLFASHRIPSLAMLHLLLRASQFKAAAATLETDVKAQPAPEFRRLQVRDFSLHSLSRSYLDRWLKRERESMSHEQVE